MRKLRITVIDDGICTDGMKSEISSYAVSNGEVIEADDRDIAFSSHGTVCAKIIEKYCSEPIELISIRILNKKGLGNVDDLIAALKWCEKGSIDIINLSNGVTQCSKLGQLFDVCMRLIESGVKIIAAQSNVQVCTYPADFPFVISVEQKRHRRYPTLMRSNIYTEGRHTIELGKRKTKTKTERCNSYACAYAASRMANAVLMNKSLSLECRLSDNSVQWLDRVMTIEDFAKSDNPSKGDLYISGSSDKQTVIKCLDKARSVIMHGKLPRYLEKQCRKRGILYWESGNSCKSLYQYETEAPVIIVEAPPEDLDWTAIKTLTDSFAAREYASVVFSDIVGSWFYGSFYFAGADLTGRMSSVERYVFPDVMLIVTHKQSFSLDYDIKIRMRRGGYQVSYENTTLCVGEANELFDTIYSALTAEED